MSGPKVSKQVSRTVKTTTRYEFTHAELCKRLRLPPGTRITVRVPGGGDWSNTDLTINDSAPLIAEVTSESSK